MSEKFNHIKIPNQWKPYWDSYPEGHTLLEALIHWVSQVNKMVDNVNDWNEYLKEFVETFDENLRAEVVEQLNKWIEDGTLIEIIGADLLDFKLDTAVFEEFKRNIEGDIEEFRTDVDSSIDNIQNRFEEFRTDVDSSIDNIQDRLNRTVVFLADFNRLEDELGDSGRIQRAISTAGFGGVVVFTQSETLEIDSTIDIEQPVYIKGNGAELRVITEGLETTFFARDIRNIRGLLIEGLRFNQNLKGRTSIDISKCNHFIIKDCYFTGYSKEYGYYKTDGGIRVDRSHYGKIINNTWEHHGDQYGTATGELNRCISLHGMSSNMVVDGNIFNSVNQAIVIHGSDIVISNNIFRGVRDNSLYLVESRNISISGNNLIDCHDEGIVMVNSENVVISGNNIKDVPNKHFALDGICRDINITGNNCINENRGIANFIGFRSDNATVENFTIVGNIFKIPINTNRFDRFYFGNVINIMMIGNTIEIETQSAQRILSFRGNNIVTGNISDNVIRGTTSDTLVLDFPGNPEVRKLIFDDNEIEGRFRLESGVQAHGYNIHTSLSYCQRKRITRMLYAGQVPTYEHTEWQVGDIIINAREDSDVAGWICTKSGTGPAAVFKPLQTGGDSGEDWI